MIYIGKYTYSYPMNVYTYCFWIAQLPSNTLLENNSIPIIHVLYSLAADQSTIFFLAPNETFVYNCLRQTNTMNTKNKT